MSDLAEERTYCFRNAKGNLTQGVVKAVNYCLEDIDHTIDYSPEQAEWLKQRVIGVVTSAADRLSTDRNGKVNYESLAYYLEAVVVPDLKVGGERTVALHIEYLEDLIHACSHMPKRGRKNE